MSWYLLAILSALCFAHIGSTHWYTHWYGVTFGPHTLVRGYFWSTMRRSPGSAVLVNGKSRPSLVFYAGRFVGALKSPHSYAAACGNLVIKDQRLSGEPAPYPG